MLDGYKIVVNTAAGRRRYMQYLVPFIVSCPIVDRYDIWVNTHNGADIEFFKRVAALYPVVNLVWQPDGVVNGNKSINAFYKQCVEPETIYFKLDDDIVWMEPGLIEKMVRFRIDNPRYFVVSPLVINNSLSTYLLQIEGKLKLDRYYNSYSSHPILWKNGHFAAALHNWFIDNYLITGKWSGLHIGKKEMGMTRFSINSILWFGDEMKKFGGVVPGDDEEFMSCIYPTEQGVSNAWNGDAVAAHFAFFTQREELDKMGILEKYGEYCLASWEKDPLMKEISDNIQAIMRDVAARADELEKQPSPYKRVPPVKIPHAGIKKMLPEPVLEFLRQRRDEERKTGFIIE
uniref:Glycosyltransferase 2-like domain-containing protein n=1 Tax=uncultured prokaryote TaxID=198431 RepID=A0A0H5Q3D2_9ZZZZ|nr:hypothetical protein [uncultured prokaryote]